MSRSLKYKLPSSRRGKAGAAIQSLFCGLLDCFAYARNDDGENKNHAL